MGKKTKQEDFASALLKEYSHWNELYENGGSDPFWEDGCNLNLVRNHIIYYKRQIEDSMQPLDYPEAYYRELPPEVDSKYMARSDEIRDRAKASLICYENDSDYQYIKKRVDGLNPKDEKRLCVRNIIGYATGLSFAIEKDDLVTMRRHEYPERYLPSFSSCAQHIRELKPPETEQLSMFSYYENDDMELDDCEMEL